MSEITLVRGPLDEEQLGWVATLYGPVDAKYASLDYLRHQLLENPFGWSLHAFAFADGKPIGHCAVIPFRARLGSEALVAGKIEALVIVEGARGGGLALDLLRGLYAFAHEQGIPLLFGLAPPRVAKLHVRAGCRSVSIDEPTLVLVTQARDLGTSWPLWRRTLVSLLSVIQNGALVCAAGILRVAIGSWRPARVKPVLDTDAELVHATAGVGAWTVSADEAWDWYAGTGLLSVVERPGRYGGRAIVRMEKGDPVGVQVVAWRAPHPGFFSGLLMLVALRRIASRLGAPALRVLPWSDPSEAATGLARTARRVGFVARGAELVVHAVDPAFDAAVPRVNPFFYVTF